MPKYTIPAFDDTNPGTVEASIVAIPWDASRKFLPPRNTGAGTVYLSLTRPSAETALDGFPLGPNATSPELGECLPIGNLDGAGSVLFLTSATGSEVRTL